MRYKKERVEYGSTSQSDSFSQEAVAFAVGYSACWVRQFAEQHAVPVTAIADGLHAVLASEGHRAGVHLSQMRSASSRTSQVLQPKVALARRPRKSVQGSLKEKGMKQYHRRWRRLPGFMVRAIRLSKRKGESPSVLSKRLKVSLSTITRHQKAVA